MNERIKELAKRAGYLPDSFGIGHWDMPEFKKFTHLMVEECIKICSARVGNSDYNTGRMHCASDIREHFTIKGYCPCCGEPHYHGKELEHDKECIWSKNDR